MYWEKFKSFLLFCLVISSFALTGIYMFEKTSGLDENGPLVLAIPPATVTLNEIIHPQGLYLNFGGDSHTAFFSDTEELEQEVLSAVKREVEGRDAQPVERSVWETVNNERSIRFRLGYDNVLQEALGLALPEGARLDEMLVPLLGRDFILLRSGTDYYRVAAYLFSALENLMVRVEAENYTEFKTIEKRFSVQDILEESGIESALNQTLIPIAMDQDIPFYKSDKLVESTDSDTIAVYVRKIFGDDPSFIKSMVTVDDTRIYVSNYGKRSLRFDTNGTMEYLNNRPVESDPETDWTTEAVVRKAWAFAEYIEEDMTGLYLLDVARSADSTTVYLGAQIEDQMLYHLGTDRGEAVEIRLSGDQIVYYRSNRRTHFEELDVSHLWSEGLSFSKIFDRNFETFLTNYRQDTGDVDPGDTRTEVFSVLNAISAYDFEYFVDIDKRSNSIIPAWRIRVADTIYHIDIYDGVLLGVEEGVTYGLEEN